MLTVKMSGRSLRLSVPAVRHVPLIAAAIVASIILGLGVGNGGERAQASSDGGGTLTCKTVNGLVACWLVTDRQLESDEGVEFSINVDGTTQTIVTTRETNPTLRTGSNCGNSDGYCYVFSFTTEQPSNGVVVVSDAAPVSPDSTPPAPAPTTPAPQDQQSEQQAVVVVPPSADDPSDPPTQTPPVVGATSQDQQGDPSPAGSADGDAAEKRNWPETTDTVSDGVVTTQIVNRPAGENVVTITPMSDGILITGLDSEASHSEAPLWPDHPDKGDSDADPGSEIVNDAIGNGQNVIVLTRPTTAQSDADHAGQWDAWYTTYLELVARGDPFIDCEPAHAGLPEECWVTDPARAPTPEDEPASDDHGQGNDPAPAGQTQTDQSGNQDNAQPTDTAPAGVEQVGWVVDPGWTDPGQVEDSSSDETDNPLLTTSEDPDDGSEIVVVNAPKLTDDLKQNEKNLELERETVDALYEAGEPYVVCFPEETTIDIHTGEPDTTPAFCDTVYPHP